VLRVRNSLRNSGKTRRAVPETWKPTHIALSEMAELNGTSVFVTGGAGFIGSMLVDRLIDAGAIITVIDNLSTGKREQIHAEASFLQLDVQSDELQTVFDERRPEIVFHLAAQVDLRQSVVDPVLDLKTNLLGSLNVLQGCARTNVKKIVFASSGGAIYGETDEIPTDENHRTQPLSPYGVAKLAAEHYLRCYEKWNGLDYTCLRYANVYGPRQDPKGEAGVVAIFADHMLSGRNPTLYGDGSMTRDYVYVDDVTEATIRATEGGSGECINIGTSCETSVKDLYNTMQALTDFRGSPQYRPARPGELERSCLSVEKARRILGWAPRIGLEEGLSRTIEWFRQRQ